MPSSITITNMKSLTPTRRDENPQYVFEKYDVTNANLKYESSGPFQGNQTVVAFYELPPGKSNYPYHYHTANEEVFYIISGEGLLDTPDGKKTVSAGDVIVFPAGEQSAHKLTNSSENSNLVYLDVDTNNSPDVTFYPDSGKLGIRTPGGFKRSYMRDSNVDYY